MEVDRAHYLDSSELVIFLLASPAPVLSAHLLIYSEATEGIINTLT